MGEWKGYGPDNKPSGTGVAEPGPHTAVSAGALTYEPHYGLRAKPFSLSTDPRTLFTAPSHAAALDELLAAIRRREGIIVLTGEMGTGKTTLCRAALYQLDRKTFTAFVPDPFISREDLLRMLLVDFGEVSVDDLRKGRLSGAGRPDLSYQLYEFLTSLESVDAFAVLVIDEAQHLGSPLLEEIRALSELEAGRRLLQIVLVGQPDLETHLRQPYMRQVEQRVTTRCELKPLSREDLGGYVCHRLALAGGTRDRVSFSPAALDLVYRASVGVPRVINLVCDRALWRGQLEQVAVISPAIVAKAMDDLRLSTVSTIAEVRLADVSMPADRTPAAPQSPAFSQPVAPPSAPAAPRAAARVQPAVPRPNVDLPSVSASDLTALLDLTPTFRSAPAIEQDAPAFAPRTGGWQSRVAAQRLRRNALRFKFLRALLLPMLGMSVMLVAGSIAMNVQRSRSASSPAQPSWTTVPTAATRVTDSATAGDDQTSPAVVASAANSTVAPGAVAATIPNADGGRWFVQVAAFESPDRSAGLVQQLAKAGMPAYQVVGADGDLHFVRVGPFQSAEQADEVREHVAEMSPDLEDAFIREASPPSPKNLNPEP
jgi:type II secretory pathway predicted ATPase ExeA/cell division septation protein DedD